MPSRWLRGVVLLVCGALGASAAAQPRTQGRERQLYVSALDAAGKPVAALAPTDVVVREDDVAREVLRVERATQPMQVALLVDNSQNADNAIKDMRDAVGAFINRLTPQHEIAIVTLADRPTIQTDYTSNRELLKKGIGRLFSMPGSGAYFLEAILETTRGIRKREAARPVIVALLTDGPEFSTQHYDTVVDALAESGTALHVLMFDRPSAELNTDEVRNRNVVMDRGTRESGGRRETLLTSMSFGDKLAELAAELSNQFVVTYGAPQTLIPPKRIEVRSAKEGLTVRGTPVRTRGDR